MPTPGPQEKAYNSEADITFFGGQAGGGKTDLLIGLAVTSHQRSVIFRREFPQLKGVRDRATQLLLNVGRYNGQDQRWRWGNGRVLEFGAVQHENDIQKWQGRAHDLKAFDEITHLSESQFRFLIGWNRPTSPGQRCRIVCAGNPPTTAEGDWVINYWGPWIDPHHPNPAESGELRYFASIDGTDMERPDGQPFEWINKHGDAETITPMSRTFIKASVQDNPYLMASNYVATLQSLPEPLRSQMLLGDFTAGRMDDEAQVIPTEWVIEAQKRWTPEQPGWLDVIGVDVARGGEDKTVLSSRSANWMDYQLVYPGATTPDGAKIAQLVVAAIPAGQSPAIHIDVIGVGSSPYDQCVQANLDAKAMNSSGASSARDASGKLGFVNKRAEWWWRFREALDPLSGQAIALPPDRELRADLTAPRWELKTRGIQIESKDDVRKRIMRSTDKGDSCIYCFAAATRPPQVQMI